MDYTKMIKRLQTDMNDEEAVNELVKNYWAFGVKTARGALYNAGIFDQSAAEDMLQISWVKVLKNIGNYNEKQQFSAWFATIIRNTCIDYARSAAIRHEQNMPQVQYDDEDYSSDVEIIDDTVYHQPEELYDQKARREILDNVLGRLKPEYRQIVTLRYVEGYTMREISEMLGVPMSTVEGRARIANAMVRDSVTEIQKRDDIKLYNLSPLPFFIWLLRDNEEPIKIPHKFIPKIMEEAGIKVSSAASAAANTISSSSVKTAASAAGKAGISSFTKIIIGVAVAAVSFGGGYAVLSQSGGAKDSNTADVEINEEMSENESETIISETILEEAEGVIWAVEPQFAFTKVKELLPWFIPYGAIDIRKEKIGYTEDWEYNATGERFGEFTANAIEVMQGTHGGVYDYSGNELYPITLRKDVLRENARSSGMIEYGYLRWVLQEDRYKTFTPDFKSLIQNDAADFGLVPGPVERRVIDGKIMAYNVYDHSSTETDYAEGTYCLMDEYNSSGGRLGKAIIDGNGNYVAHVQDDSDYDNWIVNKMIRVSNGQKYGFQSAVTGEMITDFIYDDAKFFMDGYAPVKRNFRWGYIDENGNEVTDIIFEDASMLYQGKAYVSVNGVYGIIDLEQTLNQGIAVTFASTPLPGDLAYQIEQKKADMLTKIGEIRIDANGLNVRSGPSKESPKVVPNGSVQAGMLFDVYAIEEAEGFTWYEINDSMWIADDGTWLKYMESQEPQLHTFEGD